MQLICPEPDCGKECANQRGLAIHLSRMHGITEVKEGESHKKGAREVRRVSLKFEERVAILDFFKANKGRIEKDRLTKLEVLLEIKAIMHREDINESHLNEPARVAGVNWTKGLRKTVVVKADTKILMDIVNAISDIYVKLGGPSGLLGDLPRTLTEAKEQLREELRKEQNGNTDGETTD